MSFPVKPPANVASLFTPLKLGPNVARNRIFMSPLTRNRSVPTNVPNDLNVEYYRQRAKSAGMIVTEGTLISQQGTEWPNAPGIWSKEHVDAWKKVTDAVHEEGGLIYIQLWHLGRSDHPDAPEQIASGQPVYGPSAIAARGGKFRHIPGQPGYVTPTEIDDPSTIIAQYKQAAQNAMEAGFDGAELHGANGYLPHQFLDSTSNHRTDAWGGSIPNRAKFTLEALRAIVDVWGKERVGLKLTPGGGYNDMGMPLDETKETFGYLVQEADKMGIGYIVLARYWELGDPMIDGKRRGTPHDVIEAYGPLIKNSQKFSNTQFTPEEAAKYISEGKLDAVLFGTAWIAHPDLAKRVQYGKPLDNQPDPKTFYGHSTDLEELRKGYTDYPEAKYD
ncbi:flavo protein NADH-dependent oxidoreductase [Dendrothele bispora CBS 962.96]|uniref:Flavo protein NADH-dependent oxidoreductase n=1 Tax=Dendrothele bispora (strain CBS 962.96) TaxID=1314807 RepID=A0A4S8LMI2_DENBC|nr:flavo protein NADH-dependent oxidoreductase [Dendrothele bispora CBS 962.96]